MKSRRPAWRRWLRPRTICWCDMPQRKRPNGRKRLGRTTGYHWMMFSATSVFSTRTGRRMNPQPNGDPLYRVQATGRAADQLVAIMRRAEVQGRAAEVRAAYRFIRHRLRMAPREFGEATAPLPAAHIDLFTAAVAPLVVHYGV